MAKRGWGTTGLVVVAAIGGVVLGVVVFVLIFVGVVWFLADSPSEHAQKKIDSAFVNLAGNSTAKVTNCKEVLRYSDQDARVFRCWVDAEGCRRSYLFSAYRQYLYGIQPYAVSTEVFEHPCRFSSDPPE